MASKAGKSSKAGRNSLECKAYASSHRREKNKLKKLMKHLKLYPDDKTAEMTVAKLKVMV
jgi:hypothetical protein